MRKTPNAEHPMQRGASLYRRVLGGRFDALPEVLRRFHDTPGGGRARGTFQVERAGGWLSNQVANLLGLPKAGSAVSVDLRVLVEGERERWVRHFNGRQMESIQWARGDLLMERFGPVTFSSTLVVEAPCLRYEFGRAWFLGVPLPGWLAPLVEGDVSAGEGGWRVEVRIGAAFFGKLVRYEGWIEPI